jgi:ferritin-like protein
MTIEYHEPPEELTAGTRDLHRVFCTLVEEMEAIDWYQHRVDVTNDDELRELFLHNRNEEMEHAAMALEVLRRRIPELDEKLRAYLFTTAPISKVEEQVESGGGSGKASDGSLGIGSLKGDKL